MSDRLSVADQIALGAFSEDTRALVDRYVEHECAMRLRVVTAQHEKERRGLARRNQEIEAENLALHRALLRLFVVFEDRARSIIRELPLTRAQNRTRGQYNRMVAPPMPIDDVQAAAILAEQLGADREPQDVASRPPKHVRCNRQAKRGATP